MKRGLLVALAAVVGTALAVAAVVLVVRGRPAPGYEVVVRVARAAPPDDNEHVAQALESAMFRSEGLLSLRSESTASGVELRCRFADAAAAERAQAHLASVRATMPDDAAPPLVLAAPPHRTVWMRAPASMRDAIVRIPGVLDLDACGEPLPPRPRVRVDSARLGALDLDLTEVMRKLPFDGEPDAIAEIALRAEPEPVLVRDVAEITMSAPPARCATVAPDAIVHVVRVRPEDVAAVTAALLELGGEPLGESSALSARIAFPPGATTEARVRALAALREETRGQAGITPYAAIVREDGDGELVYAAAKDAPRASIDRIRAAATARPGIAWAGARGAAVRGVQRLEVVVPGEDLDALERAAEDVKACVGGVAGVIALVGGPRGRAPERRVEVDRAAAARAGVTAAEVARAVRAAFAEDELLAVEPSGEAALGAVRLGGAPLATLVRITEALAPAAIVRIQGRRAVELEWEVEDRRGLVEDVEKAIATTPWATARLVD